MRNHYVSLMKKDRSCPVLNKEFLARYIKPITEKSDAVFPVDCGSRQ